MVLVTASGWERGTTDGPGPHTCSLGAASFPWCDLHSSGVGSHCWFPARPQILPEHQGRGRGPRSPPARQTEHTGSSSSSLALPAPRCPTRHRQTQLPHSSQLDLPAGKQVPRGLFPVSSRGAARSASSIPGKQQHRGHCATGTSLAAGMCPQGLQVLSGHGAVPRSRATLQPGHSR